MQQHLAQESHHPFDQQWDKEKTDAEDLKLLVIGMQPCSNMQEFGHTTTAGSPRTSTSAFSEFGIQTLWTFSLDPIAAATRTIDAFVDNFQHCE